MSSVEYKSLDNDLEDEWSTTADLTVSTCGIQEFEIM